MTWSGGIASQLRLAAAYAAVAAIMVQPLVNFGALDSASYEGDARFMIWTLAWDNHATLNRLPLFNANTFFPASGSLAYTDHLFGLSLFTLPIYAATGNPVLAYNIVWLLSFVLCGLAMHALARHLTGSSMAGLLAGLIYTYSFYRMLHAPGHLGLIWTWPLPLSLLVLSRWAERPSFGRALVWAGLVTLQALTSWYLAVMALLANSCVLLWSHISKRRSQWSARVLQLVCVSALAAVVVLPFALPYRALPPVPVEQIASFSADLASYLVPPENTWGGKLWSTHVGRGPRWIWGERTLFLGYVAIALACLGCVQMLRAHEWRTYGVYVLLIAAGVLLSFGPSIVRGEEGWSVFGLLSWLPGFSGFRTPARYALLVVLGVSVLAAGAGAAIERRFGRRGTLAIAGVLPLMLSEWYILDFPGGKPQSFPTPPIYRAEVLRSARALVSLPDYRGSTDWYRGADYLLFSTVHWRPIVNGYGRAEPPGHPRAISHMSAFPGPNNARTMRELGVEYVVVHTSRYVDGARPLIADAMTGRHYDFVGQVGSDYLFRVKPAP